MLNPRSTELLAPTWGRGADNGLYAFTSALSGGDAAAAGACFMREGCLITPDGTAIHGRSEIVAILGQMTARRTEIEIEQLVVREAADVALATGRLKMRSDGPEGRRVTQGCAATATLRLVEDAWKVAILSPWAAG